MKKLSVIITTLCLLGPLSISAFSSDTPFSVGLTAFSLNTKLTSLSGLDMGYKLSLTYLLNKNFYLSGNIRSYQQEKFGVGMTVGYKYPIGKATPYAEIGFSEKPTNPGKKIAFAYDVGLQYKLAKHLHPYVEFDNFTIPDQASALIGASVPLNNRFALSGSYAHDLTDSGDGFQLKLGYAF